MFRVTSLTEMPEAQQNRLIKRIALLIVVVLIAFVGLYALDRFRMPSAAIVDRELSTLEDAVRADPADVASRGRLADLYLAKERYDDAIAQYSAIIATNKELEISYASRGRAYELNKNLEAAAADYSKVVEITKDAEMAKIDPTLELAYYGLGSIALQQGHSQDAIDNLLKALAIQKTDADAMNLLGAAYAAAGQPDKALQPLRKAIEFVPTGWADPYTNLATAYTKAGDADEAAWAGAMATFATGDGASAQTVLAGLVNGKAKVDANVGLGLIAESRGDGTAAAAFYRAALAVEPDNTAALLGIGRTGVASSPSAAPASPAAEGSN